MTTLGDRLREERAHLGLSQSEFGAAAGVGKHSQINYESNKRSPDARYLAAIAALGADVLYVLTGQRMGGAAAPTSASVDATRLWEVYELVEWVDRKAGKRWSARRKLELAVKGYNILLAEPGGSEKPNYARVMSVVESG